MLAEVIGNTEQKPEVRILASLALKNEITSKDIKTKAMQAERWTQMPEEVKTKIRGLSLSTLIADQERVARSCAQLIAAIAEIDLPQNSWPDLMNVLVENTKADKPSSVKKASLLTIGYICETADPNNGGVVAQSSGILTAIIQGAQSTEPDLSVRLTAINALVNSLEFIKENFNVEGERNFIMQVVCEATQAPDSDLQVAAFGALARIMSLYYQHMSLYMQQALFGLTIEGMNNDDEKVACMAVEFWCTVCEEEWELQYMQSESLGGTSKCFNFAASAVNEILPKLLPLLTKKEEDADEDDWNISMAAAACLQLFARNTRNDVVVPTLSFVESHITSEDWKSREAAVMAFGSILEGPDEASLPNLVKQALPALLALTSDASVQVRDTVAWCLGRIAELVIDGIDLDVALPKIIETVINGLNDNQKVATNCCWIVMNLADQLSTKSNDNQTGPMSKYYESLVPALLTLASNTDINFSTRASAYEALSNLVIFSPNDVIEIDRNLATEIIQRLEATIPMQQQIVSIDDKTNLEELQVNLLGLLTNIIRRLESETISVADRLMEIFLRLLENKLPNSLIEEDVFIAIGAVAGETGEGFDKYMEVFFPYLVNSLKDPDYSSIGTLIGLVADISHALGTGIIKYSNEFMSALGTILQNPNTPQNVKPMILSCFGDIASSLGPDFIQYLQPVMAVILEASQVQIDQQAASNEFYDFVVAIKEAVVDAYVGIVTGLRDSPVELQPYIEAIISYLRQVYQDPSITKTESLLRSVVGLLGDIASMYPPGTLAEIYKMDWITEIIRKTRSDKSNSQNTRDTAKWAREQQKRQCL